MNAIKSVEIRNFQSHEHTYIEFAGSGLLTVITGATDCGKTAIVRAIKWALFNLPRGLDFMRAGAEFTQVTVAFTNGITVIRERRKTVNRYVLILHDGERQQFDNFGDNVPIEIQRATGMIPVHIADLDLMLQLSEQLDGPFLGTKSTTGPARAKIVGKLAGTEVIDHAGREVARDLHRAGLEAPGIAAQIAALEQQIAGYDWLPTAQAALEQATAIEAEVTAETKRLNKLIEMHAELLDLRQTRIRAEALMQKIGMIPEAVTELAGYVDRKLLTEQELLRIATSLQRVRAAIQAAAETIRKTEGLEEAETKLQVIDLNAIRRKKLADLQCRLDVVQTQAGETLEIITRTTGTEEAMVHLRAADLAAKRRQVLASLKARRDGLQYSHNQAEEAITKLAGVLQALKIAEAAGIHLSRAERLRYISKALASVRKQTQEQRQRIKQLAHVDESVASLDRAARLAERRQQIERIRQACREIRRRMQLAKEAVAENTMIAEGAERTYVLELRRLGKCPTCGASEEHQCIKSVF